MAHHRYRSPTATANAGRSSSKLNIGNNGGAGTATYTNLRIDNASDAKQLTVTGGTGAYRAAGGEGTLVESGDGPGSLTLQLLALARAAD